MKALLLAPALLAAPASGHTLMDLMTGTFTNGEQVYFETEAGEETSPWYGVRIAPHGADALSMQTVDAFGAEVGGATVLSFGADGDRETVEALDCTRTMRAEGEGFVLEGSAGSCADLPSVLTAVTPRALTFQLPGGRTMEMRRANAFTCWAAVRKDEPVDADAEWSFDADLTLHDQGGRAVAGGGDSGAPEAVLRMRNVVWPEPTSNRPSLVLYIHTADDPDRAAGYAWADPDADRVGINLRWMQGSCTRSDGGDRQ